MRFLPKFLAALHDEEVARLRRLLALRLMKESGVLQRQLAGALDISQSAVSQQLKAAITLSSAPPELLREAAVALLASMGDEALAAESRTSIERIVGLRLPPVVSSA